LDKDHLFKLKATAFSLLWVPPAKLYKKLSRRTRDKQFVLKSGTGTVTGFPMELDFRVVVSRIRFKE